MPRDGAKIALGQGARKERWKSIVTDEQRRHYAISARRVAVALGCALDGVASLARATSPRFTPLLVSAHPTAITGHLPR